MRKMEHTKQRVEKEDASFSDIGKKAGVEDTTEVGAGVGVDEDLPDADGSAAFAQPLLHSFTASTDTHSAVSLRKLDSPVLAACYIFIYFSLLINCE